VHASSAKTLQPSFRTKFPSLSNKNLSITIPFYTFWKSHLTQPLRHIQYAYLRTRTVKKQVSLVCDVSVTCHSHSHLNLTRVICMSEWSIYFNTVITLILCLAISLRHMTLRRRWRGSSLLDPAEDAKASELLVPSRCTACTSERPSCLRSFTSKNSKNLKICIAYIIYRQIFFVSMECSIKYYKIL